MYKDYQEAILPKRSTNFWIGLFLIFGSYLLNGVGIALSAFLTYLTGNTIFLSLSIIIYIISWLFFLLGIYLAKQEGLLYAKMVVKKFLKRLRK